MLLHNVQLDPALQFRAYMQAAAIHQGAHTKYHVSIAFYAHYSTTTSTSSVHNPPPHWILLFDNHV